MVRKGLKKDSDPGDLERVGFTPEQVQALLSAALSNNRFVNLRLAASIVVCFWCTARYEEAMKLIVGNVQKRGLSMRVMIKKGKRNLEMKPQLAVVQPNSKESVGNYCPVKILEAYMRRRRSIPGTGNGDSLFPKTQKVSFGFEMSEKVVLPHPVVAFSYDSFRQELRRICETDGVISTGVDCRYTPHSLRIGGLSMMCNGSVAPAFIQKAGRHKETESTNLYMNPIITSTLHASNFLCEKGQL